ncbi:MAG: outer membrane lipoprotein carrier protein LolA [Acidobacteriota bacterium]
MISRPGRAAARDVRGRPLLSRAAAILFLLGMVGAASAVADDLPPDPEASGLGPSERIDRLINRIEYEQARTTTLRSGFEQRKESELLLEPEVSKGRFWFRSPDAIRWDFAEPDETQVVVNEGTMLTWFKAQGTAEKVDVGGKADRIMEYLSATNSLDSLRRYFHLQAVFPDDVSAPYRLELEPRFRRVRKRLESMEIHLDRRGYFPVYVRYVEPGGDQTEFHFQDVEKNVELGEDVFTVVLPDDVEVRNLEIGAGS